MSLQWLIGQLCVYGWSATVTCISLLKEPCRKCMSSILRIDVSLGCQIRRTLSVTRWGTPLPEVCTYCSPDSNPRPSSRSRVSRVTIWIFSQGAGLVIGRSSVRIPLPASPWTIWAYVCLREGCTSDGNATRLRASGPVYGIRSAVSWEFWVCKCNEDPTEYFRSLDDYSPSLQWI